MKTVKSILLGLLLVMFQSSIMATNYHIICVAGPDETIENDFLKQKIFLGLFKKLIKVRNKKSPRNSQIKFESFADKNFSNYNTDKLANKLLRKLIKHNDKDLILIGIGQGSEVIEKSLDKFYVESQEEYKGWSKIVGEQLIEKLGIRIDADDFDIVLDLLALGCKDSDSFYSYLKVDFRQIDNQLEPLIEQFYELASRCCTPKTQKIVKKICSGVGVAVIIALITLL